MNDSRKKHYIKIMTESIYIFDESIENLEPMFFNSSIYIDGELFCIKNGSSFEEAIMNHKEAIKFIKQSIFGTHYDENLND